MDFTNIFLKSSLDQVIQVSIRHYMHQQGDKRTGEWQYIDGDCSNVTINNNNKIAGLYYLHLNICTSLNSSISWWHMEHLPAEVRFQD